LGVKTQPRQLLAQVEGAELEEYEGAETCCGFGGTFCVKYSDISDHMVQKSVEALADTDAELVLGGDLGCLMNIQGKLSRLKDEGKATNLKATLKVRHIAEVLAGMADNASIGEPDG
jgi:L-lactate dehydrogenase complex protein LldE